MTTTYAAVRSRFTVKSRMSPTTVPRTSSSASQPSTTNRPLSLDGVRLAPPMIRVYPSQARMAMTRTSAMAMVPPMTSSRVGVLGRGRNQPSRA